jgi:hypothetical protein
MNYRAAIAGIGGCRLKRSYKAGNTYCAGCFCGIVDECATRGRLFFICMRTKGFKKFGC